MEKKFSKSKIIILSIAILVAILSLSIAIFGIIESNKNNKQSEGATAVNFSLGSKNYTIYQTSSGHDTIWYNDSGSKTMALKYLDSTSTYRVHTDIGFYYFAYLTQKQNIGSKLNVMEGCYITIAANSGFTGLGCSSYKFTGSIDGADRITNNSGYALIYAIMTEINSKEDLRKFASYVNGGTTYEGKTVKLTNDIEFTDGETFTPIGTSSKPFKGTFDGNGHEISNLKNNLFNYTSSATIQKLMLRQISSSSYSLLINSATDTCLNNIFINKCDLKPSSISNLDNDGVGSLIGVASGNTTIVNCGVNANITTSAYNVGGMIGNNKGTATINNSYYRGDVNIGAWYMYYGGLAGGMNSTVSASNNYIAITGGNFSGKYHVETVMTAYFSSQMWYGTRFWCYKISRNATDIDNRIYVSNSVDYLYYDGVGSSYNGLKLKQGKLQNYFSAAGTDIIG